MGESIEWVEKNCLGLSLEELTFNDWVEEDEATKEFEKKQPEQ